MPSKKVSSTTDSGVYTTSNGAPVSEPYAAQRAGIQGPLLLQGTSSRLCSSYTDNPFSQTFTTLIFLPILIASASRNAWYVDILLYTSYLIAPPLQVHAKGAGAHGYFEVTHDLSDITSSLLFTSVGKKVRATVRFSTVGGESGSADTARDPRGFAIKLRTEEGNLDWVFNNTPVFFIRDPAKFPHFIHTQKRDPQTHLKDADMFWVRNSI